MIGQFEAGALRRDERIKPATLKCPQCGVTVRLDHIGLPNRCHANCPLDLAHSRAPAALPPHGHPIIDE